MKTSLALIPVSKVSALFPVVKDGIEESITNSGNGMSTDLVLSNLIAGYYNLWVAFDGPVPTGCAVTEVHDTPLKGVWVNIIAAHSKSDNGEIQEDALKEIEEFGKQISASGIRFLSSRPGYKKRAEQLGYKAGFVEYFKEFSNGSSGR